MLVVCEQAVEHCPCAQAVQYYCRDTLSVESCLRELEFFWPSQTGKLPLVPNIQFQHASPSSGVGN